MRYAEYQREIARLDQEIAKKRGREVRATGGGGPWYLHVFPDMRRSVSEKAARERLELVRQRTALERQMFCADAMVWNSNPAIMFRRTVPSSADAITALRSAADAALSHKE